MTKVVDEIFGNVGLNIQIPYLEREKVFGSTKQNLGLSFGHESNSLYHNYCINYNISKLFRKVSPSQCCNTLTMPRVAWSEGLAILVIAPSSQLRSI